MLSGVTDGSLISRWWLANGRRSRARTCCPSLAVSSTWIAACGKLTIRSCSYSDRVLGRVSGAHGLGSRGSGGRRALACAALRAMPNAANCTCLLRRFGTGAGSLAMLSFALLEHAGTSSGRCSPGAPLPLPLPADRANASTNRVCFWCSVRSRGWGVGGLHFACSPRHRSRGLRRARRWEDCPWPVPTASDNPSAAGGARGLRPGLGELAPEHVAKKSGR